MKTATIDRLRTPDHRRPAPTDNDWWCRICHTELDDHANTETGDCVNCGTILCGTCYQYDPHTGDITCPPEHCRKRTR